MTDFYEQNHEEYFKGTVGINPSSFLTPLTQYLQPGDRILDVGCGSGRDLLWLAERGFEVQGLERSPGLSRLARNHAACPVMEVDLFEFDFSTLNVNAVVLIGALVHVTRPELPQILQSISTCLVPGGYLLISMKEGTGVGQLPDGRVFTYWQQTELESLFRRLKMEIQHFARNTSAVRPGDVWIGYVLRIS